MFPYFEVSNEFTKNARIRVTRELPTCPNTPSGADVHVSAKPTESFFPLDRTRKHILHHPTKPQHNHYSLARTQRGFHTFPCIYTRTVIPELSFLSPFMMDASKRTLEDRPVSPTTSRIFRLRRTSSTPIFTLTVQQSPNLQPVHQPSHTRSHSHRSSGSFEIMAQIFEGMCYSVSFHIEPCTKSE